MYPIPANATRIRYLEASDTGCILDTGVETSPNLTFEIDALLPVQDAGNYFVFGSRYDGSHEQMGVLVFKSSSATKTRWSYGDGNATESSSVVFANGTRTIYSNVSSQNTVSASGIGSLTSQNSSTFSHKVHFGLFSAFVPTNGNSLPGMRVYGANLYQSGTLVRSFVPLRIGSTGYLFDRVSGQLFGNAGTGSFVLGPDTFQQGVVPTRMMSMGVKKKLPYDKDIEYIEINGDGAYINTGIIPQNNPAATIRAQYLGTGQSSAAAMPLFGVRNYGNPMKAMNFWVQSSTLKLAVNYNARDTGWQTQTTNTTAFHDFGVTSTGGTYDGTQFVSYSESVADTGLSCLVGAVRQANVSELVVTRQVKLRIASFALYNGGVLAFDGIAVRKGTTGYLYDKVSKQLFGNAGTGSFVLGPDK